MVSETAASYEHALTSVTCLVSGLDVFGPGSSDHERSLRVLKSLHAFHVYANEYWLDHLLAVGVSDQGFDNNSKLYSLMCQLSSKLALLKRSNPEKRPLRESGALDDRLLCLKGLAGLYDSGRATLEARLAKSLDKCATDQGKRNP